MGRGALGALSALARSAWRGALELLLPATCAVCERLLDAGDQGLVCGRCWARVAPLAAPRCGRCGHPLRGVCRWCRLIPPWVHGVRSVCWMHRGTGAAIVHALKYQGWPAVATQMATRMARVDRVAPIGDGRVLLVPVPLAPARERERGFNQSALLARALAPRWGLVERGDILERARSTQTQTRLTPEERLANVSDAFRVRRDACFTVRNAHVILVDDVVTTAATLNACAAALRDGGACGVSYVTFGRAPAPGDR